MRSYCTQLFKKATKHDTQIDKYYATLIFISFISYMRKIAN